MASSVFFALTLFTAADFVVVVVAVDFSFVHFTDTDLVLLVAAATFFLVVVCFFSAVIDAFFVPSAFLAESATIVAFFKSIESIASAELFSDLIVVVFVVVETAFAALVFAVLVAVAVAVAVETVLAVAVAFVVDTALVVAVDTALAVAVDTASVIVVDSVLETATSFANFSSFVYLVSATFRLNE